MAKASYHNLILPGAQAQLLFARKTGDDCGGNRHTDDAGRGRTLLHAIFFHLSFLWQMLPANFAKSSASAPKNFHIMQNNNDMLKVYVNVYDAPQ